MQTSMSNPRIRTSYYIQNSSWPYLDYGDIIYKTACNSSFHQKTESVQYNIYLAITGVIKGTLKEKFYDELGLNSLQLRRWFRKMSYLYKSYKHEYPEYRFKLVPLRQSQ